ncbi:serine/threonine-protein kinase [Actinomadura physcomitrii]|uniref:serine/threonine-protein kinase n=1 Tax=Actinomadura physcomitrii TaxID=2650748 RepID=UPI00136C2DD6|nr:serine/threonine-protein kinase [Actinomadura physcomitrii]
MPEPSPLLPTDLESIGRYRLEGRLGAGGQGTVYLGRDERERRTAIKVLHPHLITHEVARSRFLAEVEIAKRVAPFCTAQVLDSGVLNDQPFIVSEFVDGPSLQTSVKEKGPRGDAALDRLAINTVTALAAIHEGGVVHRDFKPGNVLLGPDGPVVIDFGISRALDLSQSLTSSQVVGTPGYMAPEHIDGQLAGPPADMFAWAAAMVFAATGKRAFSGTSASAVALAVLHSEPDLNGLEGDLADIVRSCLEKDPARRPTATEVSDLLRALRTPQPAVPPVSPPRPAPASESVLAPEPPVLAAEVPVLAAEAPVPAPEAAPSITDSDQKAPAAIPGRRRLRLAATAATLLAIAGVTYFLIPGPEKGEASRPRPVTPPSTFKNSAPSAPRTTPSKSEHARKRTPSSKPRTPSPSSTPAEHDRPKPPSTRKPVPSGPRTLGTLTPQDQGDYCGSHGYPYSVVLGDQVACSRDAEGSDGTIAGATTVCRWKYSGRPNVRAEGKTCISGRG